MKQEVVVVDRSGRKVGIAEKLHAHRNGFLHRAFSVFLFNEAGEMLVQQRAKSKYHFAGLWSNACCSHPKPGEKVVAAARRRVLEELGISCRVKKNGVLIYKFFDEKSGLTEHEFDHVLAGEFSGPVPFNQNEVAAIRWVSLPQLKREMQSTPEIFTPWFREIMKRIPEQASLL